MEPQLLEVPRWSQEGSRDILTAARDGIARRMGVGPVVRGCALAIERWACLALMRRCKDPYALLNRNAGEFQEYNFRITPYVLNDFPGEDATGLAVLDLGCGDGGKAVYLALHGAAKVVGIDPDPKKIGLATTFASAKGCGEKASFICAAGNAIPCPGDAFDRVISSSVLEHVDPDQLPGLFEEVYRVLKPGGRFLIRFHPYRSPYGAHLVYIPIPWAHFLFHEQVLLEIFRDIHRRRTRGTNDDLYDASTVEAASHIWEIAHLNRLTLGEFEKVLRDSRFRLDRADVSNKGVERFLAALPVLREFITRHAIYVLSVPEEKLLACRGRAS